MMLNAKHIKFSDVNLGPHRPYFCNSHSLLSRGQTFLVFSHREMQWKWNAWLQIPQAALQSSLVAEI